VEDEVGASAVDVDGGGGLVDELLLTPNGDIGAADDVVIGDDDSCPRITVPTGIAKVDELSPLLQQPKLQQ
jgi:hypothetical protein